MDRRQLVCGAVVVAAGHTIAAPAFGYLWLLRVVGTAVRMLSLTRTGSAAAATARGVSIARAGAAAGSIAARSARFVPRTTAFRPLPRLNSTGSAASRRPGFPSRQQVIDETKAAERGYARKAFTEREAIELGSNVFDVVSLLADGSVRDLDPRWGSADANDVADYQSHVLSCPECAPVYAHVLSGVQPVFLPEHDYYGVVSDAYIEVRDSALTEESRRAAAEARRREEQARRRAHRGSQVFP